MENKMSEIDNLKEIVKRLRAKDGCPWDRVQTHETLKAACVEEAAEVVSGINILEKTGDPGNLKEELGDLLLQVMFHAVIAEEEGYFTFDDVAATVSEKMVRRHPHVFSGINYESDEERHAAWEEIKKKEKEGKEWQGDYLKDAMNETTFLIEKAKKRKGFSD
ncbi:MazG nucleotide pyrophosphohydrolase domain-containing protein [Eubacterium sp.]|uniref:MazG nucleotide pyrophosphohydrolase domain-containing protein n=1 Tax=Eubacterium sp. TaxID=142586 RepID=UPI002588F521|nr:MazG nucleotide pyrophosphohydrolase domain-containing protein [Eubacterium sp.]